MNQPAWQAMGFSRLLFYNFDQITSAKCYVCFQKYTDLHRRTGNFLPGEAINHLPKKFSEVSQVFIKESKRNEGNIATT